MKPSTAYAASLISPMGMPSRPTNLHTNLPNQKNTQSIKSIFKSFAYGEYLE